MDQIVTYVMDAAGYVWPFLLVLGVVVFVHEMGHFWTARRCGVKCETFSIGFGPEIFHWFDRHGTRWRLAWIPLGGYVKMYGDADPSSFGPDEAQVSVMTDEDKKVAFFYQPLAKRFAIVAAGPAANYVFAAVALAMLYVFVGQAFTATRVDQVMPASAAEQAGMRVGDVVLSIDGKMMESFEDIRRAVSLSSGEKMLLSIQRDEKVQEIQVTPRLTELTDRFGGVHKMGQLGIVSQAVSYRQLGPEAALGQAFVEVWNITAGTLKGVGQMIIGLRGSEELGGPLRIAEMSGKVARDGLAALIWFMAVISVNLGLINLFPIPMLDGGHLLFYAAEGLRGKPLGERVQEYGFRFGATLVLCLMVFATWNDLVHLQVVSYIRGLFS